MGNKIYIGNDHAGYDLKLNIKQRMEEKGIEVIDCGTDSSESVDYPDFGHQVANGVIKDNCLGIVICGSGNGINMSVNKHKGVRGALSWKPEIAELARQHNDANILALPARFISKEEALAIVEVFLNTPFEGGRHARRVNKIDT